MDSTTATRDAKNLRRRAYNHGRSVREQAHTEGLRMMRTHRADVVAAHLQLALVAEAVAA